jgi:hypothetical protein
MADELGWAGGSKKSGCKLPHSKVAGLADEVDGGAESKLAPGPVGGVDGSVQSKTEGEAGAVSERQTKRAGLCDQIAREPGMLGSKGHGFRDGAERGFPSIGGREAATDEFAVNLGKIDGAGGGRAQKLGRELFGSRLLVQKSEESGSVQNDRMLASGLVQF